MSASRGRSLVRTAGALYVIGLVLAIALMRFVGEHHWATTILLYLPRLGFFLPLPFIVGAYLVVRDWLRALVVLVVAALLVVFPLMGWKMAGRDESAPGSIRVMSWNTYFGRIDNEAIYKKFLEEKPDILLGQATAHRTKELFRADPAGYFIDTTEEFFLATRFPIVDVFHPPDLAEDAMHHANFVRYTLQTPSGLVDVYNVHPKSPRTGIERFRGTGLRTKLAQGELPDDAAQPIAENTLIRRRQVEAVAAAMKTSKNSILLAGDTNLPTLSWLFHQAFSELQDGFAEAGKGLGYSFPAKRPWMRIDRVLADDSFRFLRFKTGTVIASDHHYVVADLVKK